MTNITNNSHFSTTVYLANIATVAGVNGRHKLNTWWRHQMEALPALLVPCVGNSPFTGEFPTQRPVTRSFGVFFDLRLNNAWVNNLDAGDSRRHRAHYDVIVMTICSISNTLRPWLSIDLWKIREWECRERLNITEWKWLEKEIR